jgi:hypothetical protein
MNTCPRFNNHDSNAMGAEQERLKPLIPKAIIGYYTSQFHELSVVTTHLHTVHLHVFSNLLLYGQSGRFSISFSTQNAPSPPILATCPLHLSILDFTLLTVLGDFQ